MYQFSLNIYVLWHPEFKGGQSIANNIYSRFTRNIIEPLSRGIGIPVYFRSIEYAKGLPCDINFKESVYNAVILLVDNKAIINWKDYAKDLSSEISNLAEPDKSRLFPISISLHFKNIGSSVSENNFIRAHTIKNSKIRNEFIISQLTHELCRMLINKPRISASVSSTVSNAPVHLFLSHAKKDGAEIAKCIKSYADTTTVKTFFDSIDIAPGHKFKDELDGNIERSALLVIQTDSYSSREWCRWEVLNAKKNNKPVIVINAIEEGEERSFPYLGNVPTIRWKKSKNNVNQLIEKILNFTLYEVLRYTYTKLYLSNIKGLVSITGTKSPKILSSPPELLTLLEKSVEEATKGKIVIYPDPPLSAEELELLSEVSKDYSYLTPTFLLAHKALNGN